MRHRPACPLSHRHWLLAALAWLLVAAPAAAVEVVKSPADARQYEYLVLPNALQVILVSDPDTDKAAASLNVAAGSADETRGREGLSHFLEHMLFLGTRKYPQAGEYQQFISAHGGNQNAYTAFENTNYHFDIERDSLEPALDRFAQFFISPTFTKGYVQREREVVHSEYQARLKEDERRAYAALQQVINPQHPLSRFTVGSLETLADRPGSSVRDELIRFYSEHYSADAMTLAVLGREPLPVLRNWVTEKFAAVPNRNLAARRDSRPPLFTPGRLPLRINVIPLMDVRQLQVVFPLPSLQAHYRQKPVHLIATLLGHEGPGSLLSVLKRRGWADEIAAGPALDNRDEAAFAVSITLTEGGLGHVDDIVSEVFAYLRLVRERGIEAWRYDEQARMAELAFRYSEKSTPLALVTDLAENLQVMAPGDALRGRVMMSGLDTELTRSYLDRMVPDNALIAVMARGLAVDAREHWYDTGYSLGVIDEATRSRWRTDAPDRVLALPEQNPFIPEDTAVKSPAVSGDTPMRIMRTPGMEMWFKQDASYGQPRAEFYFSVRSPVANDSPAHAVLTDLYTRVVSDQLNEFAYPAIEADLGYRIYPHIRGFTVRISGFDDKQQLLVERIVDTLRAPAIDPERFRLIREAVIRGLENAHLDSPYEQTLAEVSKLLVRPSWTEASRIEAARALGPEDLRRFVPELLERVQVVALAHGNLLPDDARRLAAVVHEGIALKARPVEVLSGRVVRLEQGDRYSRTLPIDHPDSSVAVYVQGSDQGPEERAHFEMLVQAIAAPFYNELRTERQLGYIVQASSVSLLDVPGIAFLVQSPKAGPGRLRADIEDFLAGFRGTVEAMDSAEFETYRNGLLTRVLQNEENLRERSDRYWREIDLGHYDFDSRERLAAAVGAMRRADFRKFYVDTILAPGRKTLIVGNTGANHAADRAPAVRDRIITEPETFGSDRSFYSVTGPVPTLTPPANSSDLGRCGVPGVACAEP
jgi:secreted Zn-dependent insulinase-like peptidase